MLVLLERHGFFFFLDYDQSNNLSFCNFSLVRKQTQASVICTATAALMRER
jgi:hypothetical protein